MQAAEQLVEVAEARGYSGQPAVAFEGSLGRFDGHQQRLVEGLESALGLAAFGQMEELLLVLLDLLQGALVDAGIEGPVDHVLAEFDELAAQEVIVDGVAVVAGVDDGYGVGRQAAEILGATDFAERFVALEEGLQRDRAGDLAALDQLDASLEDAPVHGLEKVFR